MGEGEASLGEDPVTLDGIFSIQVTLCVDGACYQPSGIGQKRVIS